MGTPPASPLLKKWMDETVRVDLTDGRVIIGTLVCTDNTPNIILTGSEEYWVRAPTGGAAEELQSKRNIGMVMISGRHILRLLHLPKATTNNAVQK